MLRSNPVLAPYRQFSERPDWLRRPGAVLAVALFAAAIVAAGTYGAGALLATQVSGTVAVDNPDHPGERACGDFATVADGPDPEGCDQSATVERSAGEVIREAFAEAAVLTGGAFLLSWLLGGAVLHLAAVFSGCIGTVVDTYSIAAWSGVPLAVTTALGSLASGVTLLWAGFADVAGGASVGAEVVGEAATMALPIVIALGVVGATLQARIWYAGLVGLHHVSDRRASTICGVLWIWVVLGTVFAGV